MSDVLTAQQTTSNGGDTEKPSEFSAATIESSLTNSSPEKFLNGGSDGLTATSSAGSNGNELDFAAPSDHFTMMDPHVSQFNPSSMLDPLQPAFQHSSLDTNSLSNQFQNMTMSSNNGQHHQPSYYANQGPPNPAYWNVYQQPPNGYGQMEDPYNGYYMQQQTPNGMMMNQGGGGYLDNQRRNGGGNRNLGGGYKNQYGNRNQGNGKPWSSSNGSGFSSWSAMRNQYDQSEADGAHSPKDGGHEGGGYGDASSAGRGPQSGVFGGMNAQGQPINPVGAFGDRVERYSRKVFVGGLPPDIDEDEITNAFRQFGSLIVDWPHKNESKSYFPPKGYCFLLFEDEAAVQALIETCVPQDNKLYWSVSSPTMKDKPVQIRPWNLTDSDYVLDGSHPLDPRKTIFVGGVPRPLKAIELATIMDRFYGNVCYAGIDVDPDLKYPKGAGRVAFSNQQSYIAAINARFVQLQHSDIDKRVEVKPYVLDDQMCDECSGLRCGGKFAPFFCANVTCLQYYCEYCWAQIHARPGREYHKPLVKEGADRPRAVPFPRWP